jgi:hypothetical protein
VFWITWGFTACEVGPDGIEPGSGEGPTAGFEAGAEAPPGAAGAPGSPAGSEPRQEPSAQPPDGQLGEPGKFKPPEHMPPEHMPSPHMPSAHGPQPPHMAGPGPHGGAPQPPPDGQQQSQQNGLKALYWRQQTLAQQQQQLCGIKPNVQANDGAAAKPDAVKASRAEKKNFFMVVGASCDFRRGAGQHPDGQHPP